MLITENIAVKVRKKRAVKQLGKVELSKKLGITPPTLSKLGFCKGGIYAYYRKYSC
ncbi:TPA: hypothetical protein VL627_000708 [Streptococcus pyogenes]|nr:hypothetical protein [Streptococcus pyogenes]HER6632976.1 hypothetical protein [Streptococcus pyogenes]HER8453659.1 hypothetical protein [Streptococcus pyogenes]HER9506440.1 hypothetical protein [Streptococcus pyogenes]HES2324822.1 hypothetical protein [Streptococcus pyogenes]